MKSILNFKTAAFTLVAAMILTSCSQSDQVMSDSFIQKRKYNKGFFIAKKSAKKDNQLVINQKNEEVKEEKTHDSKKEKASTNEQIASKTLTASANEKVSTIEVKDSKPLTSKSTEAIKENVVASKKVEKLIEKAEKAQEKQNLEEANAPAAAAPVSSGKDQLIALLLVIFVGGIGIHRFYLGYTWQGVVQLLTGGGCGIWALIDLIRIITGDLQPKDGKYSKTL